MPCSSSALSRSSFGAKNLMLGMPDLFGVVAGPPTLLRVLLLMVVGTATGAATVISDSVESLWSWEGSGCFSVGGSPRLSFLGIARLRLDFRGLLADSEVCCSGFGVMSAGRRDDDSRPFAGVAMRDLVFLGILVDLVG